MSEATRLRAGDEDRERTVELLRVAHVEGRLDAGELEERTGAAYTARYLDELPALTADLPGARPVPARRPASSRVVRRGPALWPAFPVLLLLCLLAVVASFGALAHGHFPVPLLWFGLAAALILRHRRRSAWAWAYADPPVSHRCRPR